MPGPGGELARLIVAQLFLNAWLTGTRMPARFRRFAAISTLLTAPTFILCCSWW